jgi:hypothetical protein
VLASSVVVGRSLLVLPRALGLLQSVRGEEIVGSAR